ncbi:hypothetical protein L1049_022054 [Liquidambar formosana]|uniref:Uncharacterized protein n=1 Tax=Liquidambar formosana TaxID=63359 RepID=A0AAP0RD38_LIQFO
MTEILRNRMSKEVDMNKITWLEYLKGFTGIVILRNLASQRLLKFNTASPDDDTLVNPFQKAGGYSQQRSSEVEAIRPENGDVFGEGVMKTQFSESEEESLSEVQDGMKTENVGYFGEERFRKQSSGVSSHSHSRNFGEVGMKKQSSDSEEEFLSEVQDGIKIENVDYFGEERFRKQSSGVSSRTHSRTFRDDYDDVSTSNFQNFGNDASEDPLVGMDHENVLTDSKQTHSHGSAPVVFDESSSDDDDYRFDVGGEHNRQETNLYFPSPGRKSTTLSANTNPWSSGQTTSESLGKSVQHSHFSPEGSSPPEFSESLTKSAVPSQSDDLVPVTFDDSDGLGSEIEEEMDTSKLGRTTDPSIFSRKENVYSRNPVPTQSESQWFKGSSFVEERNSGSDRNLWSHSSSDDLDPDRNQGTKFSDESQKKSGLGMSFTHQSPPRLEKTHMDLNDTHQKSLYDEGKPLQSMQSSRHSFLHEVEDSVHSTESPDTMKDSEFLNQSSSESGKELNLGMLTGGLRNKGIRRPPYIRNPSSDASSSSKQAAQNTFTTVEPSTASPAVGASISSGAYSQKLSEKADTKSHSRTLVNLSDSDDDESEELSQQAFTSTISSGAYNQKLSEKAADKKSRSRPPATFSYLDDDESKEEPSQQTFKSNREPHNQKAEIEVKNKSSRKLSYLF